MRYLLPTIFTTHKDIFTWILKLVPYFDFLNKQISETTRENKSKGLVNMHHIITRSSMKAQITKFITLFQKTKKVEWTNQSLSIKDKSNSSSLEEEHHKK